jgi:hypothetical protein
MDREWAATTLEKAAEILKTETVSWCQENFVLFEETEDERGHVTIGQPVSACAMGALYLADGQVQKFEDRPWDSVSVLFNPVDRLGKLVLLPRLPLNYCPDFEDVCPGHSPDYVEAWNDDICKSREEVIDLFENAAKDLRNGEPFGEATVNSPCYRTYGPS